MGQSGYHFRSMKAQIKKAHVQSGQNVTKEKNRERGESIPSSPEERKKVRKEFGCLEGKKKERKDGCEYGLILFRTYYNPGKSFHWSS